MKANLSRYWPIFAALVVLALAGWKGQAPPVDTRGVSPAISSYAFLGVSGTVTLTGYYTDVYGQRLGNSFSLTVNAANGTNAGTPFASIPSGASGAVIKSTGDVYFDAAADHTDMTANYANYPKIISVPDYFKLGR